MALTGTSAKQLLAKMKVIGEGLTELSNRQLVPGPKGNKGELGLKGLQVGAAAPTSAKEIVTEYFSGTRGRNGKEGRHWGERSERGNWRQGTARRCGNSGPAGTQGHSRSQGGTGPGRRRYRRTRATGAPGSAWREGGICSRALRTYSYGDSKK